MNYIKIISRKSKLALWQSEYVARKIKYFFPNIKTKIIKINTLGDNLLKSSLELIESKDLFIKELENKILNGHADIAVHSLKDIPYKIHRDLIIGAIIKRDNPYDAFISLKYTSIENLPYKSIIGTSSLRRKVQILSYRPDLKVLPIRGNVETRIKKMIDNKYDAIILSAAGLLRLNLKYYITKILPTSIMIPACGQGIIAIECLKKNKQVLSIIKKLEDYNTKLCCSLERKVTSYLNGDCKSPLGIFAEIKNNNFIVKNMVSNYHGTKIIKFNSYHNIKEKNIHINLSNKFKKYGASNLLKMY